MIKLGILEFLNFDLLFQMTIRGSIFSIVLILLKSILIKNYGGSWYYYIWLVALFAFCIPYKFDIFKYITQYITPFSNDSIIDSTAYNFIYTPKINHIKYYNMYSNSHLFNQAIPKLYFIGILVFSIYYFFIYIKFNYKLKLNSKKTLNPQYINCLKSLCYEMNQMQ